MTWREGDEVWLLGADAVDASALAGSERAARDGILGGAPRLDLEAAARLVAILGRLVDEGILGGAHDASIGGLAVAAARMAITTRIGADLRLAPDDAPPSTAAWFGERGGRVIVAVAPDDAARLERRAGDGGVRARHLGRTGGDLLRLDGAEVALVALREAWETGF
jgi:phosphoribosylformylglycinamidine synthase